MSRQNRIRLIETRDLRAPLITGEQDLSYESAYEAGLEGPGFDFNWRAYRWFLIHGYITREGFRSEQMADESQRPMPERLAVLDELEAIRTGPELPGHEMVRHAFRSALRSRKNFEFPTPGDVLDWI